MENTFETKGLENYIGEAFKDWSTGELVSLKDVSEDSVTYNPYVDLRIKRDQDVEMTIVEFTSIFRLL